MQNQTPEVIYPEVIYNVGCLKQAFHEVRLARIQQMQKEPIPPYDKDNPIPLTTPAACQGYVVSAVTSLQLVARFNDTDFIGLPCVPEELVQTADATSYVLPFHQLYLERKYTVLSNEQAQSLIDDLFKAHQPVAP